MKEATKEGHRRDIYAVLDGCAQGQRGERESRRKGSVGEGSEGAMTSTCFMSALPMPALSQSFMEKPKKFVSDQINAGLYLFNPSILDRVQASQRLEERTEGGREGVSCGGKI